jgi:hypothetical protein
MATFAPSQPVLRQNVVRLARRAIRIRGQGGELGLRQGDGMSSTAARWTDPPDSRVMREGKQARPGPAARNGRLRMLSC